MKKYFCFCFVLLLLVSAPVADAGTIIVNHDEWTLSNAGFSRGDADNFALNIGNLFADRQPGKFLVYSGNFGLSQSRLADTMTNAGHTWNINRSEDTSLSNLLQYDGIFLADTPIAADVLIDYVNSGGNVYLAGGTTSQAGWHANLWNEFLNNYGLNSAVGLNGVRGSIATTSDHPLFDQVSSLYYNNGNYVSLTDPADPNAVILEGLQPNGLIGVYNAVPIPATVWLFGSGLGLLLVRRRKRG